MASLWTLAITINFQLNSNILSNEMFKNKNRK